MSLPACQQRILDGIGGTLQARDPRFASLFSIFTRLTRHEPMPPREELDDSGWLRRTARGLRKTCSLRRIRELRPWTRLRPVMAVPVVLAAIIGLLAASPLAAGPRPCGPAPALHAAAHQPGQAAACRMVRARTMPFSRR